MNTATIIRELLDKANLIRWWERWELIGPAPPKVEYIAIADLMVAAADELHRLSNTQAVKHVL